MLVIMSPLASLYLPPESIQRRPIRLNQSDINRATLGVVAEKVGVRRNKPSGLLRSLPIPRAMPLSQGASPFENGGSRGIYSENLTCPLIFKEGK
jgi:hypothetical protein